MPAVTRQKITLAELRASGVRGLLIYCLSSGLRFSAFSTTQTLEHLAQVGSARFCLGSQPAAVVSHYQGTRFFLTDENG